MVSRLTSLISNPIRCIGTYHKTGTVWMSRVFRDVADAIDAEFVDLRETGGPTTRPDKNTLYLDDHSQFPSTFLRHRVRGIRIVRDPRDVVISGAHYHAKSAERWLHVGRPFFDGKTYAEMITSFDAMADRYLFEMDNVAADTISNMVDAKGDAAQRTFLEKNFRTMKYEKLIDDRQLREFRKVCRHLRLPFKKAAPAFIAHSLFANKDAVSGHGRSGKKQQWKSVFDQKLGRAFADRHQRALEVLGYEKDDSWVEGLKP